MSVLLILLAWLLIAVVFGSFFGLIIKIAGKEPRTFAGGVVARAVRDASAPPQPDRYAAMDAHIEVLGHDSVLQWLPESIVDDFNGKNAERARQAALKEKAREARRKAYEDRIARSADPIQTKRQIVAEIIGKDPDYSTAREQVAHALGRQYETPATVIVDGTGRTVREYNKHGYPIRRPMDNGPARW